MKLVPLVQTLPETSNEAEGSFEEWEEYSLTWDQPWPQNVFQTSAGGWLLIQTKDILTKIVVGETAEN